MARIVAALNALSDVFQRENVELRQPNFEIKKSSNQNSSCEKILKVAAQEFHRI